MDKEDLLALRYWEMPSIRCEIDGTKMQGRVAECRDSNPWIEVWRREEHYVTQVSWACLLSVLNDPFAPAIPLFPYSLK